MTYIETDTTAAAEGSDGGRQGGRDCCTEANQMLGQTMQIIKSATGDR